MEEGSISDTRHQLKRYSAFTDHGQGGNPAGVVLNAEALDAGARLALANEVGYSETAFVEQGEAPDHYRVRYFSPKAEVPFCGHATIATAVALAELRSPGLLDFSTLAGPVAVETALTPEGISATLRSVPSRIDPVAPTVLAAALRSLGWAEADLDPRYPPRVAYAGAQHLVLVVASRARLAALDYDYAALSELMSAQDWTTLQLVWAESPALFHSRNPFPPGGIIEDPATGAAAAAFGGYLRALKLTEAASQFTILQGEEMGRPSRLLVDLRPGEAGVRVTGLASPIITTG
ncbi:PhzF family phenazine biosynthesis protein [Psychromicrobium silvestre]|uniref:PhzF family phenazine biosynthesis protein n=1 Tax=Psychromicrobium silvestre TaxID=1645614 RepID=A0A7Y9S8A3_9MICC|nr:PhzF family phenazine biosynthesis isomerase [Psychromicrobium silvestre]NYE96664.1 PhzF family phenazine biosynthesis protein [Psychromicrobium silvestre]